MGLRGWRRDLGPGPENIGLGVEGDLILGAPRTVQVERGPAVELDGCREEHAMDSCFGGRERVRGGLMPTGGAFRPPPLHGLEGGVHHTGENSPPRHRFRGSEALDLGGGTRGSISRARGQGVWTASPSMVWVLPLPVCP